MTQTSTPPAPAPAPAKGVPRRVIHATAIHSRSLTEIDYIHGALIGVDETGVIAFLEREVASDEVREIVVKHGWSLDDGTTQLVSLGKGEFVIPGYRLIDTHTHAPQHINASFGQQYELLDWLKHVTFPAEARFKDPKYARSTYEGVVQRVINSGTTTCCWYGTLHMTTKVLAAICHRKGQRALVGKCNMDRNSAPDYQEESAAKSLADTEEYVAFVREHCSSALAGAGNQNLSSLVQPILTPRFAISCTDRVLQGLGEMMDRDPDLPLQTHLAENPAEIEFTKSLYPSIPTYTAVYDHFKLLRSNTILAHCVHLDESELDLIRRREAGVSHCPNSNFNLRSGTSRVADMLDKGIKVGLGTDVSGGTAIGILSAIRSASTCSKTIIFTDRAAGATPRSSSSSSSSAPAAAEQPRDDQTTVKSPDGQQRRAGFFASSHLTLETLFYLATVGGAQLCRLEHRVGSFEVGKEFDALLIETGQQRNSLDGSGGEIIDDDDGDDDDDDDEALLALQGREDEVSKGSTFPRVDEGFNPSLLIEPDEPVERVFEKFLFAGDDRNIGTVFVRGRVIGGARPIGSR